MFRTGIAIPESSLSSDCNPLYKSISKINQFFYISQLSKINQLFNTPIAISKYKYKHNRYIHRGVIGGILLLGLTGCGAQRVMVRDCQDMKGTPRKNCELIQKL